MPDTILRASSRKRRNLVSEKTRAIRADRKAGKIVNRGKSMVAHGIYNPETGEMVKSRLSTKYGEALFESGIRQHANLRFESRAGNKRRKRSLFKSKDRGH